MVIKNFFSIYMKKETYFNLLYVFIISSILSFIYSLILYPLFGLGFATLIFLVGVLILVMSLFAVRLLALFDRIVLNLVLDADIHEPDHSRKSTILKHIKEIIVSKATWNDIIYLMVVKPICNTFMFISAFVLVVLSLSLILIGFEVFLETAILIFIFPKGLLIILLGFLLMTLSLHAVNFLMEKYVEIAKFFLHDDSEHKKEKKRRKKLMTYSSDIYKERKDTNKVKQRPATKKAVAKNTKKPATKTVLTKKKKTVTKKTSNKERKDKFK